MQEPRSGAINRMVLERQAEYEQAYAASKYIQEPTNGKASRTGQLVQREVKRADILLS